MAAITVTNTQFRAFDPSREPYKWEGVSAEEFPFHPVVGVTWYEAVSFCRWLATCFPWARGVRLPLEEEWEHAGRAGEETRYWSGKEEKDLARVGWYEKNSESRTHPVGEKECSPWGLYDVHGNVWEWTLSAWTGNYERRDGEIDPLAVDAKELPSGEWRVLRGGSAGNDADRARAAYRDFGNPDWDFVFRGFRVMLPAVPELIEC